MKQILLLALFTALTAAVRIPYAADCVAPCSDFHSYNQAAQELAHLGPVVWSSRSPSSQDAWNLWTPGYPIWLAILYRPSGGEPLVALAGNLLLAVATGLLLLCIGNRLAPGAGWVAWGLWALAPQAWLYSGALASENLAIPLLLLAVWQMLRRRWWGTGLALGGLLLTRAALAPMVVVMVAAAWAWQRNWRHPAAVMGALLILVLPWTVNRSLVNRRFVPLTTSGAFNLWLGTHPDNPRGGYTDRLAGSALQASRERKPWLAMAVRNIARQPGRYLVGCGRRAQTWVGAPASEDDWQEALPDPRNNAAAEMWREKLLRPFWLALALVGTVAAWRRRSRLGWLLAGLYWCYAASVALSYSLPRFILPSIPLASLLGGAAVVWALAAVRKAPPDTSASEAPAPSP